MLGEIRAPAKAGALLEQHMYPHMLGVWIEATLLGWPPINECKEDLAYPDPLWDFTGRTARSIPVWATGGSTS